MSKEAALRAMREAKYARSAAAVPPATGATKATKPTRSTKAKPSSPADVQEPTDALCGHRSMNGRTCTREAGHAAKSHRYS